MIIREINLKEIAQLSILAKNTYTEAFGNTMSREELEDALSSRSEEYFKNILKTDTILVAVEDDSLLGFIQFGKVAISTVKPTSDNIELNKIYIDQKQQGKGIGKSLIRAMLNHEKLKDVNAVYLDVYDKNENAIRLYEKFGFKTVGKTPFKANGKILGYDLVMKLGNVQIVRVKMQ